MAESSGETKVYLRLVIDEEKNKVVLAEAGKDFVDVLFSFLQLPMGTIARLFKKHNKDHPVSVGCFNNLYTNVVDMGIDNFQTEACKRMLLCPRSVSDVQCQRLKVNINPTEGEKYFKCPSFSHCRLCSNFSTTRCRCGNLMKEEIHYSQLKVADNMQNGVFISGGGASTTFIITDDLEVAVKSTGLVLERLKSLGCADVSKLGEKFVGIGSKEVVTLLQCVFSSNAPLTETFLNNGSPQGLTKSYETSRPCMEEKKDEAEPEKVLTINAVVRNQDMKILFVECGEDFVELLLSFLAVSLESVLEISGNSITFGCLANLCRSFKDLSVVNEETKAASADSKGVLPCFYSFQVQLPGIITLEPPVYYRFIYSFVNKPVPIYALTRDSNKIPYYRNDKLVPVTLVDPKSHGNDHQTHCSGFLKKETQFTVSDDLVITPMSSCSTVCLLKKLQTNAEDIDVQEIDISKAEAVDLLRASLLTSCALSSALGDFIAKKPRKEPLCQTQLRRSQRKKQKVNDCQAS
ncbi:unnamed protein product [Brassica rapa]|uniref:DUF674 family protein n=1 Tax=Brassica campestris TaxID=3711 RepID=A0A3P6AJM9_BRACM|nr:unnamed protein product [Brassica rapa]VDC85420.1 unnamed protein product [Brassica rapa]